MKLSAGRWDTLFGWLRKKRGREITIDDLSCEALPRDSVPEELDEIVTSLRRLSASARASALRTYHGRPADTIQMPPMFMCTGCSGLTVEHVCGREPKAEPVILSRVKPELTDIEKAHIRTALALERIATTLEAHHTGRCATCLNARTDFEAT